MLIVRSRYFDSIGFFYPSVMKCRVQKIVPNCDYSVEGIAQIWLLDFEDFEGFRFLNKGNYDSCYVTDILRSSEFIEVDAPDMIGKYNSTGNYTHTIETFIGDITADTISNLHLATKRKQIPLFKSNSGKVYTFGYEAGATINYNNQTGDGFGSVLTISSNSIYPLFECNPLIISSLPKPRNKWNVDFNNNTYCIDV